MGVFQGENDQIAAPTKGWLLRVYSTVDLRCDKTAEHSFAA